MSGPWGDKLLLDRFQQFRKRSLAETGGTEMTADVNAHAPVIMVFLAA